MNSVQRKSLRRNVLAGRDALSQREQAEKSAAVTAALIRHRQVVDAELVFIYMHFRSEVQTADLISLLLAAGKTIAVPYTLREESRLLAVRITDPGHQVQAGYCGIPEPLPHLIEHETCAPEGINVVIVPGSVFDRTGGRLGYGGGFYDRFFCHEAPGAVRIALAYELQLVDRVPVEAHDQFMDFIVTEKTVYECRLHRDRS